MLKGRAAGAGAAMGCQFQRLDARRGKVSSKCVSPVKRVTLTTIPVDVRKEPGRDDAATTRAVLSRSATARASHASGGRRRCADLTPHTSIRAEDEDERGQEIVSSVIIWLYGFSDVDDM